MPGIDRAPPPQAPVAARRRPPARAGARGIPLFRVFGIQIRLDWSWLIIFFAMVFLLRTHFRQTLAGQADWAVWLLSAGSVIALFACVLAHELAHSVVAIRHGIQMFDITLFVFGGMARLRGEPKTPNDELKIALAGPAVTVVLAAVFWAGYFLLADGLHEVVQAGIRYLAFINTALLVFNLIPGFPLDGGRVLRAILWKARGNLLTATRTAADIGRGFGMLLIVIGLLMIFLIQGGLVAGLFNLFLGWFLAGAANQSIQHMQIRHILEFFHVSDAMNRSVVSVESDMTLDRLVTEGFYRYHFKAFPIAQAGRFEGMVNLADVQRVPPPLWPATTVAQVADPASRTLTIHPDDGLYDAFRRMGEEDVGRLVVTDPTGHVVGILSRRDIMNLLQVYSELSPSLGGRPPRSAIPVAHPIDLDLEESADLSEPDRPADEPGEPAARA